jgi:hypothetical protein
MTEAARVKLVPVPGPSELWDIELQGSQVARLVCETRGERSLSRLYFEGDVRPEVMRQVLDEVETKVLSRLPPGVCTVHRAHLVSSIDVGRRNH